jgi:hypothetical protein
VVVLGYLLFFSAMVSTCSSISVTMNADDAHANNADAAYNTNANADDANNANVSDTDAADKAEDSKLPDINRKVGDKRPPDTDATLPLPTSELARQADDLQAHLSVFPNGHLGPSGDRLLAEMELELLKRGTEKLSIT